MHFNHGESQELGLLTKTSNLPWVLLPKTQQAAGTCCEYRCYTKRWNYPLHGWCEDFIPGGIVRARLSYPAPFIDIREEGERKMFSKGLEKHLVIQWALGNTKHLWGFVTPLWGLQGGILPMRKAVPFVIAAHQGRKKDEFLGRCLIA